jgi:WD40 repeat protein
MHNSLAFLSMLFAVLIAAATFADDPVTVKIFDNAARAMSISPDGKTVAVGEDGGRIALWDVRTKKVSQRLNGHTDGVRAVQFSPDGTTLVSGAHDNTICFWSTENGKLQRTVKMIGKVEDACFSPDGQQVAVTFREGDVVLIIDSASGKELRRMKLPFEEPLAGSSSRSVVTFSPDGSLLAATSGGRGWPRFVGGNSTISLWEVADWTMRASFVGDRFTMSDLGISADGRWLAGATNRGKTVKLWEISPPTPKVKVDPAHIERLIELLNSDDFGEREAAQRELEKGGRAAKDALEKAAQSDSAEMRFRVQAVLKKLSRGDIQPARVLPKSTFDVHSVAFSPDGKWLASGRQFDRPGNVILYRLGNAPGRIVAPHNHGAWIVAFTRDGKQLITGRRDGHITIWDLDL